MSVSCQQLTFGNKRACQPPSLNEIAAHKTDADPEGLQISIGFLPGRTMPMRLEGFRTCIDFVQHDCVGLVLRYHYLELQRTRLRCKVRLRVSPHVVEVLFSLARNGLDGCHHCKFGPCASISSPANSDTVKACWQLKRDLNSARTESLLRVVIYGSPDAQTGSLLRPYGRT
jgi:hypothetical protein